MKRILLFINLFILLLAAKSQIYDPVKWDYTANRISETEAELIIQATIEDGWHLYSQNLSTDEGPVATDFQFEKSKNYELIGKTAEGKPHVEFDPNFNMDLAYFAKKAVFKQKIKCNSPGTFSVKGSVYYMVCDNKMCLPPEEILFNIKVPAYKASTQRAIQQEGAPVNEKIVSEENNMLSSPVQVTPDANLVNSGILEPVKWLTKVKALGNNEFQLIATATIDEGWHVYSMHLPRNDGPEPTEFKVLDQEGLELLGEVKEVGEMETAYDPNFQMDLNYYSQALQYIQKVKITNAKIKNVKAQIHYMTCDDARCLPPTTEDLTFELPPILSDVKTETTNQAESKQSVWEIFIIAFLAGIAALITPCVFPMIPLTVSFFTKQNKNKAKGRINALTYTLFIIGVYVLLSLPFHIFDSLDPSILNNISTNVYLNIFFFIIFIVFAMSFLGAFEITLPNSWINKADSASNKGGMIGIFFMALTLVLVSFSCTGPVLGALLGGTLSTGGGAKALTVGMAGFGFGLGLPFGLFALFPSWLNALPKSGGWLNRVKVVLGFLELAMAFKFLSNADLVLQAGLLKREVFLAIWIAIFLLMTLYLLGVFRMAHDSPTESLTITRLMFATVSLIFTLYLLPGLWGAPLKLISGFPPPMFYSEFPNGSFQKSEVVSSLKNAVHSEDIPEGVEPEHCPHNLPCFHDYDKALAYAKKVKKPLMIDFTGWACVNCRRMEEQVWSDPRVLQRLRDDVVLVSLYVDEKLELPESEQIEVQLGTKIKKLKTIGDKWAFFQVSRYKTNSQPYYVIVDNNENMLVEPTGYDPDVEKYIQWLDEAKQKFYNNK
jgi:thiol:disulfide interchange protein DsbD